MPVPPIDYDNLYNYLYRVVDWHDYDEGCEHRHASIPMVSYPNALNRVSVRNPSTPRLLDRFNRLQFHLYALKVRRRYNRGWDKYAVIGKIGSRIVCLFRFKHDRELRILFRVGPYATKWHYRKVNIRDID